MNVIVMRKRVYVLIRRVRDEDYIDRHYISEWDHLQMSQTG